MTIEPRTIRDRSASVQGDAKQSGAGRTKRVLKSMGVFALLFLPSILAVTYYTLIAADRYVSESLFVVRTAAKPLAPASVGTLLQMSGLGRAEDDVFSVQAFLTSRNASDHLMENLPVREIYGPPDADFVARYPSFIYGESGEEFYAYLSWMVTTNYSGTTGITTLRVQAFDAEHARKISVALLDLAETIVNQMNVRMHADAVRIAEDEVKRTENRLVEAQIALTRFRNTELMIDAAGSSIVIAEVISRLGAELTQLEAQIREITAAAATNPRLPSLHRRAKALEDQIASERKRISSESDGLADKLALYERLVLDREFAKQALDVAVRAREAAQQEARRQQLYLERVVEPSASDKATAPRRVRMIATAIGLNVIFVLVGWLIFAGLREHATQQSRQG